MKRGRTLLAIALIVALLATAGTQKLALNERHKLLKTPAGSSSTTSLANMDSFALALLLGGMRGPLVMFLWMQSETQKQAKDLEGIETQIEWIRLLQPEFDTVHLFQIWNKAYNLSAQMASLANKYSVILDAIEYAQNVERQRPDNVNILMSLANIFNDKLAGSTEKYYYRKRILQDTQYRPADHVARAPGSRPTRYPSLLDPQGMIKPELLAPRLFEKDRKGEYYDGSELQFLAGYQPFPYGVPAYGLAYNYYKRSQVLQRTTGQRHIQIAEMVLDSRPALCLRAWFEVEWDSGVRAELQLFGQSAPVDRFAAIAAGGKFDPASLGAEQLKQNKAVFDETIYRNKYALKLIDAADAAFREHLAIPDFQMHVDMYRSHMEHLAASKFMIIADLNMLEAATAQGEAKAKLLAGARVAYLQAIRQYQIMRLRYFTSEEYEKDMYPSGLTRWNLEIATDAQIAALIKEAERRNALNTYDVYADDTIEFQSYVSRATNRLAMLPK